MLKLLARNGSGAANEGRDSPNKIRRQDFVWSQEDREMATMLCRAHGVTFSELMRMQVRDDFRRTLRASTEAGEVLRVLCNKHKM
jgi:hypothetical protein